MNSFPTRTLLGVLVAIAITTAMDASGLAAFSALPLFPLLFLFWYWQRFSRQEMGFTWGGWRDHGLAILYPVAVMGAITIVAVAAGAVDTTETHWQKALINLLLMTVTTCVMVIITEEGFFRGWLWASLRRSGWSETRTLVGSSIAFTLWHVSAVSLTTEFGLPASQIPVYLINVVLLGAIWGMMRAISGSVIVASMSHGVWNGLAYILFGFGTRVGALGIQKTAIFGPEVGVLGLGLNLVFAAILWHSWKKRSGKSS